MKSHGPSLFDLGPGTLLDGRFEIVRAHRQGGMSTAFEVRDRERDEPCEVQLFPAASFDEREEAEEFAEALSRWTGVDSEAVLRARQVRMLEDGTVLYVTDLPPGATLRGWLQEHGRMPLAAARDVGLQLLHGAAEIHARGQVHGDIKPTTIHVRSDDDGEDGAPKVVLVDGGITPGLWSAKHLGEKTQLIGTPFYAPVEQFGGDGPTVQSDVYNIATVLYELATGVVPWPGRSFLEVFQAKLEKEPPAMRTRAPEVEVDSEFERAVAGGLRADRAERYGTAEAFRERLEALDL